MSVAHKKRRAGKRSLPMYLIADDLVFNLINDILWNIRDCNTRHFVHPRVVYTKVFHITKFRMNRMEPHTPIHKQLQRVFLLNRTFRDLEVPQCVYRGKITISTSHRIGIASLKCEAIQYLGTIFTKKTQESSTITLIFVIVSSSGLMSSTGL